jgi:adenylate cyclase
MPKDRRLAAIMFTDIVGYTAMMGSDEDHAFETLRKNREIHTKLIII